MVRETRHLWVGNLPENIREDRIREHFKRYGRVQSVKLLPRGEECPVDGGSSSSLGESNEGGSGSSSGGGGGGGGGGSSTSGGASATVAFMDIKSAAKAHATEHTLDERALTTQYYEPQHLQHRFPSHGSSEDHGSGGGSGGGGGGTGGVSGGGSGGGSTGVGVGSSGGGGERGDRGSENFDSRGSHGSFYGSERSNRVVGTGSGGVGGGGSGGGGVGHSADPSTGDPGGYISRSRPPPASSYHVTSSRARDRLYPRTGPYVSGPPPPPHLDRHRGSLPPSSWSAYEPTSSRYGGVPPPPSPATNDAYQDEQGGGGGGGSGSTGALRQHKKQRRKSRSGSSSPSGSSRSGSSSSSRSGSSGGSSSGGSTSPGSSPHRTSNVAVTEDRRPLAICVRNLPARSSDTSLKDGLFHEYKKHGKVTWVKVVGAAGDRYALVCFKKPEDVEKALEVSQDKLFFGCKIEVAPYQGYDVEDNEFRPYEAELDEYHPKATRTLFIGNLEKDVTASELRKHFEPFGEIIEIDIKKQGAVSSYAFCQYSDIGSVVKAMRSMDGEHLGANRIKLGFGKSMPTSCVWVDGIGDCMSEKYLNMQFHQFGPITQVVVDRERGHALVFFDQISCAQAAVKEMRGAALRGRRLQVDFASRECQETFYEHLERQGNASEKPWDSRPSPASSFDVTIPSRRERSSFDSTVTVSSSSNRFTRYDTPPRSRTANYSRTSGGSTPGASPAHPTAMSRSSRRSYQDSYYDADYGEPTSRRFRSYDEFSQGSGASHDDYQSSVLSDGKLNDDDCPPPSRRHTVQSVVTSVDPPAPPPPLLPPPDIRHLQKERVHLLEQLEECHSSGDEIGFVPKKRAKLDSSSTTILCEDDEPEIASLLVTSHSSRKGMEFRRVSDSKVVVHHSTRRGSCEGRGPGPCKRRRDATSRHHEHHDGSRPGTPLVDERPENLIPSEPRRFRERSHEGPLSLPLPRFAAQMLNNNNNTSSSNNNNGSSTRSSSASLAKVASPPCASLSTAPRAAPQPPASPPPRHASSSPTSSDSETAPQSPSLEERIRSLDEKYEKWSGSRALSAAGGDALAKLDASTSERFRFRHKLLDMDLHEVQPSDIVKSVLAKRSVFDEDSKRLENFSEKYEPREFTGVIGVSSMIGSTAGLTTSGSCTSKVCLQYPFPSHPPVQPTSGTSVSQIGINTSLSASLTATTTSMASSMLKTDPRIVQHNCIHPTPATPITPGTSIKTVSPELPPVSLPIGLVSGTAASSGNGSGLASASSLLSSSGSIGSIHTLGASTHRGLSISATNASPTVTAMSTDAFSTAITTAVPVAITPSTVAATTTMSVTGVSSMTTTSSIAPPSSITSSSNSSSSSSLSTSSTDLTRSRLKKETSGSNRESRDSRDGKDSRESKHSKGKDCQRRSRKEETADVERNRKDKDERESSNVMNDIGNTDNHSRDFKENKELRYERKEREEKEKRDKEDRDRQERRDKEDRDRQERRDKEDRDRQEKKEREERERREKDEERRERERQDKERLEKDRREREERERERKEREENELKEKERREKERIDRERREREEKERQERREREERERREREERERKEREIRLEREKQEKERLKREREEQEKREKEERDRLERERRREEKERLERERKREREEKERLERERRKEKEEREKMEKEKREKEERERLEKLEREKHEREKRREREDQERREKEKAEREKRRDREEKDKEKRERDDSRRQSTENHLHPSITQSQSQVSPAPVPIKRRCSSQDCPTDEDAKRVKLSDHRRDSKDRSRQNRRSEDRKHRNDSHRSSRESRESRDSKESSATQDSRDGTHSESTRENNSTRDSGSKEKQRSKKNRSEKESRERSPRVSHESDKEFLSRLELSKRNDSSPSTEQSAVGTNHRDAQHHQQQQSTVNSHSDVDDGPLSTHEIQVARNPSATDTDSDEPKKHSIFDIVDDEPAYISMYDKVKARSTKNMQKLEEEKRQVRLKDKFSQLKQSRARREEKKQSTSWDGDSVSSKALTEDEATSESDSTRTKSLSRKGSRSRIHSDTSEEEESFNNKVRKPVKTERFLESDVDLGFADTEEKQNPLEASNVIVNSVHTKIKEEPRTSDEDERVTVGFRANHPTIVVNNHERDSRKKSHKKKQKRQKNSISSEDNLKVEPNVEHKNKVDVITSSADCRPNHGTELTTVTAATTIVATALENAEDRMRADKKQRSKKEKKRDRNGEDKAKARRKRLNRQEARDSQRMEDIFGPLSDDVDDAPSNTFFNRFGNMTSENSVYASDSDGGRSSLDMDRVRRKTEKKRRHQPEDENSVDLAEAGREIEAKLLGIPSSPKAAPACTTEPNDHDVFRFTDDNDSVEPSTPSTVPEKVKEKKKKRKKSKEERSRKDYHHHHHHHHHHHEKSGELPYLGAEPSPPRASSPLVSKTISSSLPTSRETLLSPIPKVTSTVSTVPSITPSVVTTGIQTPKSEKKKDKLIPGFGIEMDETIHENAVKSISEPDERDSNCQSRSGREEPEVPVSTTPPAQSEDKPRVAISQEETEDAVAALLEETFGASTEDFSYEGEEEEAEADGVAGASAEAPQEDVEEMQQAVESLNASTGEGDADLKPDTPQSEHDLQIDTDTEEDPNYETVDLTQPPKTPDIPSFYKSPTKTLPITPVLATPEKSVEVRLPPAITKPQSPPTSVIAHSWSLNEHNKSREPVKPLQLKTNESETDVTSPERTTQVQRTSPPPPQYKQPMLVPCSVPITDVPKSISVPSSRPSSITVQPLYQRLPVSPQSQMVPMRQASPKMQNVTTVSCSSSSNTTPLPPLVPSRMPPLVPSQPSPRVSQPLSPNGQWSRNPTLNPHVPNVGKRKPSPPPTKIAVCVPIPAHRPETPVQQIYSTAATQQPVIQHASGMLAPAPGYPRGGLPPLTLNIPPRPYMPVPPLASGIQVKSSRDASLGGKSVIETLLPVNPNEPPQRLDEPKLSPAVIPEPTNKASTSPKVPSPNQPPTYIPETAKIEINASTSSPVFGKPAYVTDNYTMSSRTQKQISVSITTDSNLLSPRQKQEVSNLQLLTTHVPRSSTPSPVIVAHGQPHLLHKSVHSLGPPTVSPPNQPLIKTVVPIVPQQISATPPVPSDKCVIPQTPVACQRQSPVSQSQVVKSHIPLVSTVSQTIITRVVPSTVSSVSAPSTNEQTTPECLEPRIIQGQQLELDAEAQINQTAQPMQLTPPIQPMQPIDEIKKEPTDMEQEEEDTVDEAAYNTTESEKSLNPLSIKDEDVKQEKQEVIKEIAPCIPKIEPVDTIAPKIETETPIKLEPVSEIKEEEAVKETDEVELDEEPVEDPLKEPSTDPLAIDSKEDPIDSKEDSDYWSAKEVNIESVIKKVDALCDGEGNDGDDEAQQGNESVNSDSHDTSKNESDWFDTESTEGEGKKNFISADDHDESVETCENECTRSRRGRTKSRRGSRGGVTTRRGGRNASNVSHRRGGRSSRGSKHHVEKNKLPADVYEFHDDSEEDNAGRPRLILTIKSPGPNVTGPNAQPATPVAAVKEVPPEEFVSPAANTRKSRRLAERDGSRNTIDDVIEDVVRGSPVNKGLISGNAGNVHATRRSTRHNNIPRNTAQQPIVPLTELRKSPRSSRKAARRTSENNDDSGEEKVKEVTVTPQEAPSKEETKLVQPESPKAEEPAAQAAVTPAPLKTVSHEPMALIDPVTGMLIPMRESEEGQYIPVSTTSGQAQATSRALGEARSGGLPVASPTNEAPRAKSVSESSVLVPAEPKKEAVIEHASCQPTPTQQIQPQTSVITKPQSPAVQATSTITVAQSSTTGTTIVTTVTATVAPTTTAQPISTSPSQTKPTSLKAHVLNASKLVTSAQQQVITKPVAPSLPNQTIVQNIVKPPAQAVQGLNLQIPPGRVVSPSLSPRAKQAAPLTPTNGKQGQPMSPVLNNTGAPPNPKQHLLQAAKQQTSTIVNMPQKLPLNILHLHYASVNVNTPTPRIHQPVSQPTTLKNINGQPHPLNPKAHLLQAVVPPIGTVANSPTQPHLVNPQISTVVNSVRPPGSKVPTTGPMEPQKVEVPMSGCIMVPTASPQSRSVPMPTYEAPLHGSTGATPPGGQYGLVPPHRSQSPPLPPPAHHHANTSQSEVVNHYGGLPRDHYLHSPMFQYQYLRAQQETLTAPRIAYHIPGTRSPHLPLDPKLEPGIEDSHSPPLELRRGTRTPQDRTTDSPQIAQVYMLHGAMRPLPPPPPQYNTGSNPSLSGAPAGARANFYEPPPAHLHSQYPMAASEAPPEMGRAPTPDRCRKHQVVTPPLYASQVPPQADSFQMLLQRHPVMWQGLLALKNDQAAVQMHFVFGNPRVARDSLPCNSDGSTPPLRIAQRMRLEQTQVEGVARKMQTEDEHCMLLALPCGRDEVDVLQQSKNLQTGFIMYLQQKQAAGIVNIAAPGSQQAAYVVHIFPSCDFARETLARIAPDLHHRVAKISHLLIVIATV